MNLYVDMNSLSFIVDSRNEFVFAVVWSSFVECKDWAKNTAQVIADTRLMFITLLTVIKGDFGDVGALRSGFGGALIGLRLMAIGMLTSGSE
jgi:hypothetical protein